MKLNNSKFEDYLANYSNNTLHPTYKSVYNDFPADIKELRNHIFYGPEGVGKYTQLLASINRYSPSKLTYEKNLLGSAGTLMKNINFCENHDIFLIHADNYTQESLRKFHNFFLKMKKKKCLISLISFKSNDHKQKGILKIKNGIVHEIYEKEKVSHGTDANGAVYLIGKEALSEMFKKYKDKKDFIKEILIQYLSKISAYKSNKIFQDIGSIRDYISVR